MGWYSLCCSSIGIIGLLKLLEDILLSVCVNEAKPLLSATLSFKLNTILTDAYFLCENKTCDFLFILH